MSKDIRVKVWGEYRHERQPGKPQEVYPKGIHNAIADHLKQQNGLLVTTAVLDDAEHGLTEEALANTDVLIWWGHMAHHEVKDEIVERVQTAVLNGMGLIVLHSGHYSKIFQKLMGTGCNLKWREFGEKERVWVIDPSHPITDGLPEYFEIPNEEMYGEHFDIPAPDELVFVSWFAGGEVFRSGCCWHRGQGKIFYFRPGHETYPIYYQKEVLTVISNAVRWAAKLNTPTPLRGHCPGPMEDITPGN